MKAKIIISLIAMVFILGTINISHAEDNRFDRRQRRQNDRINDGIKNGNITPREYNYLNRERNQIRRTERHVKRDGYISPKERHRLDQMQDRTDNDIYRAKHNQKHVRKHYYNRNHNYMRNYDYDYRDRHHNYMRNYDYDYRDRHHRSENVFLFPFPNLRLAITPLGIFPVIE